MATSDTETGRTTIDQSLPFHRSLTSAKLVTTAAQSGRADPTRFAKNGRNRKIRKIMRSRNELSGDSAKLPNFTKLLKLLSIYPKFPNACCRLANACAAFTSPAFNAAASCTPCDRANAS